MTNKRTSGGPGPRDGALDDDLHDDLDDHLDVRDGASEQAGADRAGQTGAAFDSPPAPDAGLGAGAAGAEGPDVAADADAGASAADHEIAALAAALAAQKDKHLRLLADYENFKKRMVRERQDAEQKGMGLLIRGILDTLDDLTRFAHLDPATTDTKTVVEGVELVERKLMKSLAGHGLEVVNPLGAPFDPTYQEALTTVPAESKEEDHLVAQVYQVGYVFNGTLLRPARVVVKQWQGASD